MRSTKSPSWIERLLGLEPQPLPSVAFGVDDSGLRAVWRGEPDAPMKTAATAFEGPVFQEGPLGGPVHDESSLHAALERLLETMPNPRNASLVVPDAWLRLVFVDSLELPRSGQARDEMLRWRLQQLVPFRTEDLRVRAQDLPVLGGESASRGEQTPTVLVGFAIEVLLRSLEDAFAQRGVRIGNVVSESLALLSASALESRSIGLSLAVRSTGYSLLVHRGGIPLLARFKLLAADGDVEGRILTPLLRELALSRRKIDELAPGHEIATSQLFLQCDLGAEALERLCASLPGAAEVVSPDDVELPSTPATASMTPFVPLAAATRGVLA